METVLADRGYTYLEAPNWALPHHRMGIDTVIDLHTNQRGSRPGPIPGTVYLDGGLFLACLPDRLRSLSTPSLGMTAAEKSVLAAQYDERKPYAFTPMGRPDRERGTQRYRGPALTRRVRCANTPRTMRLDASRRPTTTCTPQTPCPCGTTVTLGPDDYFGTNLKRHHGNLTRGSTRVRGTNRTGILLAFIIAATNASMLHSRYGYDIANPPTEDDEPSLPRRARRTASKRSRAVQDDARFHQAQHRRDHHIRQSNGKTSTPSPDPTTAIAPARKPSGRGHFRVWAPNEVFGRVAKRPD